MTCLVAACCLQLLELDVVRGERRVREVDLGEILDRFAFIEDSLVVVTIVAHAEELDVPGVQKDGVHNALCASPVASASLSL